VLPLFRISSHHITYTQSIVCSSQGIWIGCRLFTTANGRIGAGSEDIRPADQVCMLYSGREMYVLRKHPERETYTFVCDAYIHGLMQGESFDLMDQGEATEKLFAIE
jgi:hypothetical protein